MQDIVDKRFEKYKNISIKRGNFFGSESAFKDGRNRHSAH